MGGLTAVQRINKHSTNPNDDVIITRSPTPSPTDDPAAQIDRILEILISYNYFPRFKVINNESKVAFEWPFASAGIAEVLVVGGR